VKTAGNVTDREESGTGSVPVACSHRYAKLCLYYLARIQSTN